MRKLDDMEARESTHMQMHTRTHTCALLHTRTAAYICMHIHMHAQAEVAALQQRLGDSLDEHLASSNDDALRRKREEVRPP